MFGWLKNLFGGSEETMPIKMEKPEDRPVPTRVPPKLKKKSKRRRTLSSQVPKAQRKQNPLVKKGISLKVKGMSLADDEDVVDEVLELFEPTEYQQEQTKTYSSPSYGGGSYDSGGTCDDGGSCDD